MSESRREAPPRPTLEEIVRERVESYRHEPGGVPRRLREADLVFVAGKLANRAELERLWELERARGIGGAIGITTDRPPPPGPIERFDALLGRSPK